MLLEKTKVKMVSPDELRQAETMGKAIVCKDGDNRVEAYQFNGYLYIKRIEPIEKPDA